MGSCNSDTFKSSHDEAQSVCLSDSNTGHLRSMKLHTGCMEIDSD